MAVCIDPLDLRLRPIIDLKLFRFRMFTKSARRGCAHASVLSGLDFVKRKITGKPNKRFVPG